MFIEFTTSVFIFHRLKAVELCFIIKIILSKKSKQSQVSRGIANTNVSYAQILNSVCTLCTLWDSATY